MLMFNKLPQTPQLKTHNYHPIFCRSKIQAECSWILFSGSYRAEIRVSARVGLSSRAYILFQAPWLLKEIS